MATTEERLARLERACRRWRWGGAAALAASAVGIVCATGVQPQAPGLVRATRLEIVSANGTPVLTLTQNESGGVLAVQSPTGEVLVTITATSTGEGVLAIGDWSRRRLVEISGRPRDGAGVVNVFEGGGRIAASVMAAEGGGVVQTFGGDRPTAMVGAAGGEGGGAVAVFDAQGKVAATLPGE